MKPMKSLLILTLLFISHTVSAGWYECYNFNGKVGNSPITLSFQYRPGYFGEQEKQNLNIIGCYKHDKYNNPIRLEGIYVKGSEKIILNEVGEDGMYTAYMELEQTAPNVWQGGWESLNTNKVFDMEFHLTSQLNDTDKNFAFSDIEILQAASLPDYYFTGVYTKNTGGERAYMTALKIFRKKDNTLFQTLSFEDYFDDVGNIKTIIYDHIERNTIGYADGSFQIWCDMGRMGGYYEVLLSLARNRFEVATEPVIENATEADAVPASN